MKNDTLIKQTVLKVLNRMPSGIAKSDEALQNEVMLSIGHPRPTLVEYENALGELENLRLVSGIRNELMDTRMWMITDSGRIQLGQF